jgi:hypothetical protein
MSELPHMNTSSYQYIPLGALSQTLCSHDLYSPMEPDSLCRCANQSTYASPTFRPKVILNAQDRPALARLHLLIPLSKNFVQRSLLRTTNMPYKHLQACNDTKRTLNSLKYIIHSHLARSWPGICLSLPQRRIRRSSPLSMVAAGF